MKKYLESPWRENLGEWIESAPIRNFITVLILLNALVLGLETSATIQVESGILLPLTNDIVLGFFLLEILIKLTAFGPRFFRSGWNVFDFSIVTISLIPASGPFSILRALRILRVLRLLSTVKRLKMLVDSLLHALPSIGWTAALLLMMFYIFGVMGTDLFGNSFPQWFGNLGRSIFSLFQIMTLESWSMGIARPVMSEYPYAWAFFVPFILISSFMVLNLFIAIIVSATQEVHDSEQRAVREASEEKARVERADIVRLLKSIDTRLQSLEKTRQ